MALKADYIYNANGVNVRAKIIPDGTTWKNDKAARACGFKAGDLYKAQRKLCGTGKPTWITIHNTAAVAGVQDCAELYTRATYNESMGAARVHFYVDAHGAWQNLKAGTGMFPGDPINSAEVGWHAGDSSVSNGGNETSVGIEVIMGANSLDDNKAKDNAARLVAWLLRKYGLHDDKVVSHTYWVNNKAGKRFADVDEQCTNPIYGQKWCPVYIFGSTNKTVANANWKAFKNLAQEYYAKIVRDKIRPLAVGDKVRLKETATVYGTNRKFAAFVYKSPLYVRSIVQDRAVVSVLASGAITGAVQVSQLIKT